MRELLAQMGEAHRVAVNLLDDPTVGRFVVSACDITARVAAELELRKTLSLLTATLESTADGILAVDTAGRISSFNRRFAEMWRLPDSILATRDGAEVVAFAMDQVASPEAFRAKVDELYANPEAESSDTLECEDGRTWRPGELRDRSCLGARRRGAGRNQLVAAGRA